MQNKKKADELMKAVDFKENNLITDAKEGFSEKALAGLRDYLLSVWPEENETREEFNERVNLLKDLIR